MKKILLLNTLLLLMSILSCSEDTKVSPDVGKDVGLSTPIQDMKSDTPSVDMQDAGNSNTLDLDRENKDPCANNLV